MYWTQVPIPDSGTMNHLARGKFIQILYVPTVGKSVKTRPHHIPQCTLIRMLQLSNNMCEFAILLYWQSFKYKNYSKDIKLATVVEICSD